MRESAGFGGSLGRVSSRRMMPIAPPPPSIPGPRRLPLAGARPSRRWRCDGRRDPFLSLSLCLRAPQQKAEGRVTAFMMSVSNDVRDESPVRAGDWRGVGHRRFYRCPRRSTPPPARSLARSPRPLVSPSLHLSISPSLHLSISPSSHRNESVSQLTLLDARLLAHQQASVARGEETNTNRRQRRHLEEGKGGRLSPSRARRVLRAPVIETSLSRQQRHQ